MAEQLYTTLVDMQQKSCAKYASNRLFGTKVGDAFRWCTYKEFAEQVDAFRGALAKLGVERGNKVAVIANNRVEWAVGAYATYSLGAHYVPMYEAQLPKDWKYIIEDSGAVVLLVANEEIYDKTKDFVGQVGQLRYVLCFDCGAGKDYGYAHHLELGRQNPTPAASVTPEETAGLIYTSGTTGAPKGVVLSHGNFVSNINAVHDIFPISDKDTSLSFLPWAHSFGQTVELHVLLSMGASMGICESVPKLLDNLQEVRPTLLFAVPRIFNRIYDALQKRMAEESPVKRFMFTKGIDVAEQRRKLEEKGQHSPWLDAQHKLFDKLVFSKVRARFGGNLRYAFSGGAALSREVGEFIDNMGILVYEGYGLTETSPIATANFPGNRRIGTIGKPIPGVEIYICDEDGKILPDGTDGEIVVVGPNVMQEYYKKPEATAEVIFELQGKRAFRTGDMGRRDPDGFIKITGRFKEQYKLENGKYVVPSPLEEQLKLSGFVNQAFIYGDNQLYNIALVVPDFEALEKWARQNDIAFASHQELVDNPRVHAKIGEELMHYAEDFKGYERPKKWALLTEDFTTENDLMTPSLKVKRRNVIARYEDLIASLYR